MADPTVDPATPATPVHPILANLIATLEPILLQFLVAFLAKLTPAQASESPRRSLLGREEVLTE